MKTRRSEGSTSVCVTMPVPLKTELAELVASTERSMNDVVVEALSAHYELEFTPSRRRPGKSPQRTTQEVILRLPPRLKERIRRDAFNSGSNMTDKILRVLAAALGSSVEIPQPTRTTPFGGGPRNDA